MHVLQNGSLHDGLQLWKANLDKHFSGVQDCMICFSIIHTANYSLPKLRCKTCQNKFHSACLVSLRGGVALEVVVYQGGECLTALARGEL